MQLNEDCAPIKNSGLSGNMGASGNNRTMNTSNSNKATNKVKQDGQNTGTIEANMTDDADADNTNSCKRLKKHGGYGERHEHVPKETKGASNSRYLNRNRHGKHSSSRYATEHHKESLRKGSTSASHTDRIGGPSSEKRGPKRQQQQQHEHSGQR